MKIVILDSSTLGEDICLDVIKELGDAVEYEKTLPDEVKNHIGDADVAVLNKVRLSRDNLAESENLKLICVAATGYDNIDIDYCREKGIAVCNVVGYSTNSVAQLTAAMVLSLYCHIPEYDRFTKSGEYTQSGIQNRLEPVYYELFGKTWGIIGYGNIGKRVSKIAEAFGCNVIYMRSNPDDKSVDIKEIMQKSDIISIHVPLNAGTMGLIGRNELMLCEKKPILINTSRGAVLDEEAVTEAVESGILSGFGTDVYSKEPLDAGSPYNRLFKYDNVILTPHMAWGAYEARTRCMNEIAENIKSFFNGEKKGRVV